MTTWENTDSPETKELDNIIVTSDEVFERVSSNEKMIDEWESWYLKQNTAWLVQEIPNISFLDIADTMLESKKTFYNRENWILRVWTKGRSVEAQPQDTVTMRLENNVTLSSFPAPIHFDYSVSSLHNTVCEIDPDSAYKIKILETWYYRISYWWTVDVWNSTTFEVWVWSSNWYINSDAFDSWNYGTKISGWRTISNVYLEKWDYVFMDTIADSYMIVFKNYTYLEIQFQQYTL